MSVMATLLAEKALAAARTISPAVPPTQADIMILSTVTTGLPAIEALLPSLCPSSDESFETLHINMATTRTSVILGHLQDE